MRFLALFLDGWLWVGEFCDGRYSRDKDNFISSVAIFMARDSEEVI